MKGRRVRKGRRGYGQEIRLPNNALLCIGISGILIPSPPLFCLSVSTSFSHYFPELQETVCVVQYGSRGMCDTFFVSMSDFWDTRMRQSIPIFLFFIVVPSKTNLFHNVFFGRNYLLESIYSTLAIELLLNVIKGPKAFKLKLIYEVSRFFLYLKK